MTIFNLYIYNRIGECIYYTEWKRDRQLSMSQQEEFKLLYGLLFSIRNFVTKISPVESKHGFANYQTNTYKLNYFESPSGIKFIINSDRKASGVSDLLRQIYSQVYVQYVIRNPNVVPDKQIESELFKTKLNELVKEHSAFGLS